MRSSCLVYDEDGVNYLGRGDRAHTSSARCIVRASTLCIVVDDYEASRTEIDLKQSCLCTSCFFTGKPPPFCLFAVELLSHRPRIGSCCWEETIQTRLPASMIRWLWCVATCASALFSTQQDTAKRGRPLINCSHQRNWRVTEIHHTFQGNVFPLIG